MLAINCCRGGSGFSPRSLTRISESPCPKLYKKSTSDCSLDTTLMFWLSSKKNWFVSERIFPDVEIPTPLWAACTLMVEEKLNACSSIGTDKPWPCKMAMFVLYIVVFAISPSNSARVAFALFMRLSVFDRSEKCGHTNHQ